MNGFWAFYGKRCFDFFFAVFFLVIFFPLILLIAFLVGFNLGFPIIFSQTRLGRNGSEFRIFKFRTMTDECDKEGVLLDDEYRITGFGNFLRKSSLDELPQLYNIIKGDMSLIGPRPCIVEYKKILFERYPSRFLVLPGITSLAAIRGRNALSWDEKFTMDEEYVNKLGILIDFEILLKTIPLVISRKGISMNGVATSTRYDKIEKDEIN